MATVQSVIDEVSRLLRDDGKIQWDNAFLVSAMNAAFRAVSERKPEAHTEYRTLELVEGDEQEIDADLNGIIELHNNINPIDGSHKRAITKADKGLLDRFAPNWRQEDKSSIIYHYMRNEITQRKFHVWPPAKAAVAAPTVPTGFEAIASANGGFIPEADLLGQPNEAELRQYNDDYSAWAQDPGARIRGEFRSIPKVYNKNIETGAPVDPGPVAPEVFARLDPTTSGNISIVPNGDGDVNLSAEMASNNYHSAEGDAQTQGFTSGKYFWAMRADNVYAGTGQRTGVGITSINTDDTSNFGTGSTPSGLLGNNSVSYGYYGNGEAYFNSTLTGTFDAFNNGDIIYMYLDLDAGTFSVQVNNGTVNVVVSGLTGAWWPAVAMIEPFSVTYKFTALFSEADLLVPIPQGYDTYGSPEVTQAQVDQYNADLATYNEGAIIDAQFINLDEEMPYNCRWTNSIMEYMLYYAWSVDDDMTSNSGRAQRHFNNFHQLINDKDAGDGIVHAVQEGNE